jgi:hypothetical protein
MLGKNINKAFPSSENRAQGILDLVHYNVCGPMSYPSLSGCFYYFIFINDYSGKCWIYFLKAKSDTFINSKSINPLLKRRQENTLESLEKTIEESLNLFSLRNSSSQQESRYN